MKSKGLKLESQRGDIHLLPTQATDDPKAVGPVDVVLFCVKLWDVESAGAAIKPMVAAHTAVIPLQNGLDAADRASVKSSMGLMSDGMAVAMYTTLSGLIGSILVQTQHYLLDEATAKVFGLATDLTEVFVVSVLEREQEQSK